MRVLIVDDDPMTLRIVSHAVQSFGHNVATASNGAEARRKFLDQWFPVVITDWEMPDLNGIDLCAQIRAADLPFYTYIMFLTSRRERRHLIEALAAGADDFISKPFHPQEMQVRLRVAERIVQLEADLRAANKELTSMNQRLLKMSRLDPLMEIGNRLDFEEKMEVFHRRAVNDRTNYGLVMCDVDHFKSHNDQLGHQNGDKVLRTIATTIRESLRESDAAFRYGGEEILLFLYRQDLHRAVAAADRVRSGIEQQEFSASNPAQTVRLTISCGVASYPLNCPDGREWQEIVGQADMALYEAKARGRNCVVAASPDYAGGVRFESADQILKGSQPSVAD